MFLNNADAKAAQLFTLIHELAHVWLGKSAGFNQDQLLPASNETEILCDRVAAEFLVPAHILREFWKDLADIQKLATRLKVSTIVIARRALDLELISKTQFYTFYNKYIEQFRVKKGGSGGNFYSTSKRRVSPTFASFVDSAVQSGELTYKDAFKLTGLYGNVYTQFIQKHVTTVK